VLDSPVKRDEADRSHRAEAQAIVTRELIMTVQCRVGAIYTIIRMPFCCVIAVVHVAVLSRMPVLKKRRLAVVSSLFHQEEVSDIASGRAIEKLHDRLTTRFDR